MKRQHFPRILLIVTSDIDVRNSLRSMFRGSAWVLEEAASQSEALHFLENNADTPVAVLCHDRLCDGGWRSVLTKVHDFPGSVRMVVFSAMADERMWADVLNWGAHDLLAAPFEAREVHSAAESAWLLAESGYLREQTRTRRKTLALAG